MELKDEHADVQKYGTVLWLVLLAATDDAPLFHVKDFG